METQIELFEKVINPKYNIDALNFDFSSYHFYTDGGHGWLKVPKAICRELGFEKQISGYSYKDKENYYLEEDLDLGLIFKALNINWEEGETIFRKQNREKFWRCIQSTDTSNSNSTIFIRKLQHK